MTKEEFIFQLVQYLTTYFPEEEYTIRSEIITKNNNTKHHSIIVQSHSSEVAPTIYVDEFYDNYLDKKITISEIAEEIQKFVIKFWDHIQCYHDFSLDWEDCQSQIVYRLVSKDKNKEILEDIPYLPFLDLAIVFYYVYRISDKGIESIRVTNQIQKKWGISTKTLFQLAERNTPQIFEPKMETLYDIVQNFFGNTMFPEEKIATDTYVVTNVMGINGATVLLYENYLQNLAEHLSSNLYILPSSIHEILIVPDDTFMSLEQLKEMVKDVNKNHVLDEEILSDCVYYYDRIEKKFIF